MHNNIGENLNKLSDEEISEKIKSGYFTEESMFVAVEILRQRGVDVPEVDTSYYPKPIPFRKSHPYLFWAVLVIVSLAIKSLATKIVEYKYSQASDKIDISSLFNSTALANNTALALIAYCKTAQHKA